MTVVTGGKDRAESVQNALTAAKGERVLIHDGARPLVTERMLEDENLKNSVSDLRKNIQSK